MCGIVGIVNFKKDIKEQDRIISEMINTLDKRGPDEDGIYLSNHINLGHRRLSIIDIENGKQPMKYKSDGNTYVIVYNGQIYNCDEIRNNLKEKGFEFNGYSDTEVLLKAYLYYGENVLKMINGIFAFAIWDEMKKQIFIARDHFGIKPLYYTMKNGNLIFASEIKSLMKHPEVNLEIDSNRNK